MPSQSPYRIELAKEQRAILHERARAHTAPYYLEVVRARIVQLASEGLANKEIATRLDTPDGLQVGPGAFTRRD